MAKDTGPLIRPAFTVCEARMLIHILRSANLDGDAIEEAIFRERLQNSLIKFLAVNGAVEIDRKPLPEVLSEADEAAIMAEFERTMNEATGRN